MFRTPVAGPEPPPAKLVRTLPIRTVPKSLILPVTVAVPMAEPGPEVLPMDRSKPIPRLLPWIPPASTVSSPVPLAVAVLPELPLLPTVTKLALLMPVPITAVPMASADPAEEPTDNEVSWREPVMDRSPVALPVLPNPLPPTLAIPNPLTLPSTDSVPLASPARMPGA